MKLVEITQKNHSGGYPYYGAILGNRLLIVDR